LQTDCKAENLANVAPNGDRSNYRAKRRQSEAQQTARQSRGFFQFTQVTWVWHGICRSCRRSSADQ